MKKVAIGTVFETGLDDGEVGREPFPFFGFLTGTALSLAIWVGLLVGIWIVLR